MEIPLVDISSVDKVRLAVIGGSGLYHLDCLRPVCHVYPQTPWGYPSDKILVSETVDGERVAFLARHGRGHRFNPSEVPSRANIAALKKLGVEFILAFSAVGSLRENLKPLDFVVPSQLIDRTKGIRDSTFFDSGLVAHCIFADPFDLNLPPIIAAQACFLNHGAKIHTDKTVVCMEGPAFSTRAESHMYRALGGDLINMSAVPESKLAREAEISYTLVAMVTDYDCWKSDTEHVTVEMVMRCMALNSENAKSLILALLPKISAAMGSGTLKSLNGTMRNSVLTDKEYRDPQSVLNMDYILPGYF